MVSGLRTTAQGPKMRAEACHVPLADALALRSAASAAASKTSLEHTPGGHMANASPPSRATPHRDGAVFPIAPSRVRVHVRSFRVLIPAR